NDTFEVNVEMTNEKFTDKLSEIIAMEKSLANAMKTMLGINPSVHLLAPKSIARSEGKAVRVVDKRKLV
ncbi:MAG: phenylacetate--CoA ligase, partial [Acutalibacteraceae bacterium]|nr:phenylacetate--CoA ligase [Acutalibacteraceae bacterium]